jgi:predicted dehydrogenase
VTARRSDDATRPLRLGIVSAGSVAKAHLEAAESLPQLFTVTAIADPDVGKARVLADQVGATVFQDHETLGASGLIDAVVVGSPHGLHLEHVVSLLEGGIPVLVEKPMGLSVQECHAMIGAAELAGLPLMVGHIQRFMPLMAEAKRIIDSGEIGEPVVIVDTYAGRYERGTRPDWFFDPRLAGHGIVANLGAHSLDRLMWLASSSEVSFDSGWMQADSVPIRATASGTVRGGVRASIVLHGIGFRTTEVTDVACSDGGVQVSSDNGLAVHRRGQVVHRQPVAAWQSSRPSRTLPRLLVRRHPSPSGPDPDATGNTLGTHPVYPGTRAARAMKGAGART